MPAFKSTGLVKRKGFRSGRLQLGRRRGRAGTHGATVCLSRATALRSRRSALVPSPSPRPVYLRAEAGGQPEAGGLAGEAKLLRVRVSGAINCRLRRRRHAPSALWREEELARS